VTLIFTLSLGLLLRMSLAPSPGYEFDVAVNQKWSKSAVEFGLGPSYTQQIEDNMLPNYPPLSMMVFAATGWLYRETASPEFDIAAPDYDLWIKFPAILADLLTAVALFLMLRKQGRWLGVLAASIYVLHPTVFYNSAVWGQNDALYTLPLLLGLWAFSAKRMVVAGALLAAAILTKFQAIAAFPILLPVLLRPREALRMLIGASALAVIVITPFVWTGTFGDVVKVYTSSVGFYPQVSFGAYNFWWGLLGDAAWGSDDRTILFHLMSFRTVGLLLFTSALGWIVTAPRTLRKQIPLTDVLWGAALLCFAFFLFPTQIHERYLFPWFALALPIALKRRALLLPYVMVSSCGFLNLLGVLPWMTWDIELFRAFPTIDVAMATTMVILWVLITNEYSKKLSRSSTQ